MSVPRELDPAMSAMDALEVLHAIRQAGGDVAPSGEGLTFVACTSVPVQLVWRAKELATEVLRELRGPAPAGRCPACAGAAFYRAGGGWRCLSCEGVPRRGPVPERWTLTHPEP